jgi:hypothetical protein
VTPTVEWSFDIVPRHTEKQKRKAWHDALAYR